MTESDLRRGSSKDVWIVWDERSNLPVSSSAANVSAALFGSFTIPLANGEMIECRPALQLLKEAAADYAPERSESITTVPADDVRRTVRLFATEKPSTYCTWVGLEQDNDAMQTNRAACCFYALTGQYDQSGSNVIFATTPTNSITGGELLPKDKAVLRLGSEKHPLGPTPIRVSSKQPKSTTRFLPANPI